LLVDFLQFESISSNGLIVSDPHHLVQRTACSSLMCHRCFALYRFTCPCTCWSWRSGRH
jgi:hypothetical protein